MAIYERREVTTRRVEYFLPKPCNAVEFSKALYVAGEEAALDLGVARTALSDDVIWVDATDDEIVISFHSKAVEP